MKILTKFLIFTIIIFSLVGFVSAVPRGDVNNNGYVDSTDALIVGQWSVGNSNPNYGPVPAQGQNLFCAADANNDGAITVLDVSLITQEATGQHVITAQECGSVLPTCDFPIKLGDLISFQHPTLNDVHYYYDENIPSGLGFSQIGEYYHGSLGITRSSSTQSTVCSGWTATASIGNFLNGDQIKFEYGQDGSLKITPLNSQWTVHSTDEYRNINPSTGFVRGDVYQDGRYWPARDGYELIEKAVQGIIDVPDQGTNDFCRFDINNDGEVDQRDLTFINSLQTIQDNYGNTWQSIDWSQYIPNPYCGQAQQTNAYTENTQIGDSNNNGRIEITDAQYIAQWSVGKNFNGIAPPVQGTRGFCINDVNRDGRLTSTDAGLIGEIASGLRQAPQGRCLSDGRFVAEESEQLDLEIINAETSAILRNSQSFTLTATIRNNAETTGNIDLKVFDENTQIGIASGTINAEETKTFSVTIPSGLAQGIHTNIKLNANGEEKILARYVYSNNPSGWQSGDISQNGQVQITDAQIISHMSVGTIPLPPSGSIEFCLADANADGRITVLDANKISKVAAGLEEPSIRDCRNPRQANSPQIIAPTASIQRGDANHDGRITATDALVISQAVETQHFPTIFEEWCAFDANNDGFIDNEDSQTVARQASGYEVIPDKNCRNQSFGINDEALAELIRTLLALFGLLG